MEGTCVACGEEAEGKPLYKKLGSNHLKVQVYDALIEMKLLCLPERAKTNCYICWDCDETVAEEYTNFVETEMKRKSAEKKRKEQDVVRNQKLNKKLTQAFKKAHKDSLISKGDIPPISKYKQKEQRKQANRYYGSNCILCKNPFKSSKGGFLRFNLKKMVDDQYNVYEVLQKLGNDILLESNLQVRRFICSQCYNKVRRSHKSDFKMSNSNFINKIPHTNGGVQSAANTGTGAIKRATFDEHAALITKLIPPNLADVYKVIGEDAPEKCKSKGEKVDVLDDLTYTESESESSDDSCGSPKKWTSIDSSSSNNNMSHGQPKGNVHSSQNESSTYAVFDMRSCVTCGIIYRSKETSYWHSLYEKIPSYTGIKLTLFTAIKTWKIPLAVRVYKNENGYICKSCFIYISKEFAPTSKLNHTKTRKYSNNVSTANLKTSESNEYQWNIIKDLPRPLCIKRKLAKEANKRFPGVANQAFNNHDSCIMQSNYNTGSNLRQNLGLMLVNNFENIRSYATDNSIVKKDLDLLNRINKAEYLRHRGFPVLLKSVHVNLLDIADALSHLPDLTIYTERLQNIHLYSNFMRSVKNKYNGMCILCLSTIKEQNCRWLEDPVNPPHIMVPLRWARLSLGPPDESTNLSGDDGKVCTNCYNYVKSEFLKFVRNKIGLSMDDEKVSLKNYKVSFDSKAMSVVADPLVHFIAPKRQSTSPKIRKPANNAKSPVKGRTRNVNRNSTSEYDKYSNWKTKPKQLSATKNRPPDTTEKRATQFKTRTLSGSSCKNKIDLSELNNDSGHQQSANSGHEQNYDSSDIDNASLSSSISNYSNKIFSKNDTANVNIDSTNITEFKPINHRNQTKIGREYNNIDQINNNSSGKRKRDTFGNLSEEFSHLGKLSDSDISTKEGSDNRKGLFQDEQFEEDYFQSEDNVAPFAQRKKIRTATATVSAIQDITLNDPKNITKSWENIWQILQGISIDCLLTSNELQPVKPESFTHGLLCALNFIKDEIAASDSDLVQWLSKLFPTEFRNLGRKLCKESVLNYLKDMYIVRKEFKLDIINEGLPLSFYTPLKAKCTLIPMQMSKSASFGIPVTVQNVNHITLGDIPPTINTPISFPGGTNIKNICASGSLPISLNINDHYLKIVEELEQKIMVKETFESERISKRTMTFADE